MYFSVQCGNYLIFPFISLKLLTCFLFQNAWINIMTLTMRLPYRSPGSLTNISLGSDTFLNLKLHTFWYLINWYWNNICCRPHKYKSLVFPVCRAACPRGMCGMYPFVPCRFNLIWVLGCQWESRAVKAHWDWDRETAGNPQREVIPICARLSVEKIIFLWIGRGRSKHALIRKMFSECLTKARQSNGPSQKPWLPVYL